jgi:hypothetical protein
VLAEAMAAQAFAHVDAAYAARCREAAQRCWQASAHAGGTEELSMWTLAALEMRRATGQAAFGEEAAALGERLAARQTRGFVGGQKLVRGFWRFDEGEKSEPYKSPVWSAAPALALLRLAAERPEDARAAAWRDAVRLHVEEYVEPMAARSAFEVVPYGLFFGSPTPETYRPLAGELTYRYFMPVRKQFWWLGLTAHLECYALLLGEAARAFGERRYAELAYRQLEWVMGANPFGACLMTGEGMRNPYPHSRYVGLIPGGILNGIAGNVKDEPVLDTAYGFDWRTTEYWSPHNAFYLWAVSELGRG